MARNAVTIALFFGLAIICCLQMIEARSNTDAIIRDEIEKYGVTCANYEQHCLTRTVNRKPSTGGALGYLVGNCKDQLRPHVC